MDTPATTEAPAQRRSGPGLTLLLLGTLLVLAAIFAFNAAEDSHWFTMFKVVHVLVAFFWVGGGVMLTTLAILAERKNDPVELATIARQAAFVGEKLFAPAGLVVLAMGIAMLINGNNGDAIVSWSKFWVIAGLIGYAVTFVTGIAVLSPMAKKVHGLLDERGPEAPETQAAIKRILLVARVDVLVLLVVVADMVTKPFS